jgi:formate dehydrogenase assembly factor FdhD
MKKVEEEMVQWFEQKKQDVLFIKTQEHAEDILVEYQKTQSVIQSIEAVHQRIKAKQQITKTDTVKKEESVNIVINVNDLATVKALLQATNITFEIKN